MYAAMPSALPAGLTSAEFNPRRLSRDILGIRFYRSAKPLCSVCPGQILYDFVNSHKYFIYDLDNTGRLLRRDGKPAFILSNS